METTLDNDELQERIDVIINSISNGCGNRLCENIYCKSNPNHVYFPEDIPDYAVEVALTNFRRCYKYITPLEVIQLDQNFFSNEFNKYLTHNFLRYSFINFNQNNVNFDYGSAFLFFEKMFQFTSQINIKNFFNVMNSSEIDFIFSCLCIPYKLTYYDQIGNLLYKLGNNRLMDLKIFNFLNLMNKEQLKHVHYLIHSYLYEMFNRGQKKNSNYYKQLIPILFLFKQLYIINLNINYISYEEFYVKSIIIPRDWNDDFDNFFDNKPGLLDFSFIIELFTRILVLHKENQVEQQIAIAEAVKTNFFEILHPFLELTIDRNNLLISSLNSLLNKRSIDLKRELKITFEGEVGVDQGGVSKEWFTLIIKEIFNLDFGMFTYNKKTRQYWFSSFNEDFADYELIGIVLGLAIYNNTILDISFPSILYKKLLDIPLGFDDFYFLDPDSYSSLVQLREVSKTEDISVLDLTFEATLVYFDTVQHYDLIENGHNIDVNNNNIEQYLKLYIDFYCNKSISKQFQAFKKGFSNVVTSPLIKNMKPEELELVICGIKELDFDALEKNCIYKGYNKNSIQIINFWNIVKNFSDDQKRQLLTFVTSNDRVPVGGLGNLSFIIDKYGDIDKFPTASTCFNLLHLPPYKTKEIMEEKLIFAINNSTGFGLA